MLLSSLVPVAVTPQKQMLTPPLSHPLLPAFLPSPTHVFLESRMCTVSECAFVTVSVFDKCRHCVTGTGALPCNASCITTILSAADA